MKILLLPSTRDLLHLAKDPVLELTSETEIRNGRASIDAGKGTATIHALAEAFLLNPDFTVRSRQAFGSKSFLSSIINAFYEGLACNQAGYPVPTFPGAGSWGPKAMDGTTLSWSNTYPISNNSGSVLGVGGGSGILVGSGSTAPTPADYILGTQITHGSGAGQLFYLDNVLVYGISTSFPSAGQAGFILQRVFVNMGNANVTVAEMGIAGMSNASAKNVLYLRDVLPVQMVIPPGYPALFQYTIYAGGDATANLLSAVHAVAICSQGTAGYIAYGTLGNWTNSSGALWRDTSNNASSRNANSIGSATVTGAPGPLGVLNGIVFGSGSTAHAITDYALGSIITHGTGAGQLSYGSQFAPTAPAISGQNTSLQLNRVAVNNTGGNVTANEDGLYLYGTTGMLARKLLNGGSGYIIANLGQVSGYLTIGVTT